VKSFVWCVPAVLLPPMQCNGASGGIIPCTCCYAHLVCVEVSAAVWLFGALRPVTFTSCRSCHVVLTDDRVNISYSTLGSRSSSKCLRIQSLPQVADGRDGVQIWRVAANILNKQSRTADRGWSSSLGVGRGANNPPP
jgi:hypothetical protein